MSPPGPALALSIPPPPPPPPAHSGSASPPLSLASGSGSTSHASASYPNTPAGPDGAGASYFHQGYPIPMDAFNPYNPHQQHQQYHPAQSYRTPSGAAYTCAVPPPSAPYPQLHSSASDDASDGGERAMPSHDAYPMLPMAAYTPFPYPPPSHPQYAQHPRAYPPDGQPYHPHPQPHSTYDPHGPYAYHNHGAQGHAHGHVQYAPTAEQQAQAELAAVAVGTQGHARLRTVQACEKCRVRKAKCSGERPTCGRCAARGLLCEYAPERKMRGPNKPRVRPGSAGNTGSGAGAGAGVGTGSAGGSASPTSPASALAAAGGADAGAGGSVKGRPPKENEREAKGKGKGQAGEADAGVMIETSASAPARTSSAPNPTKPPLTTTPSALLTRRLGLGRAAPPPRLDFGALNLRPPPASASTSPHTHTSASPHTHTHTSTSTQQSPLSFAHLAAELARMPASAPVGVYAPHRGMGMGPGTHSLSGVRLHHPGAPSPLGLGAHQTQAYLQTNAHQAPGGAFALSSFSLAGGGVRRGSLPDVQLGLGLRPHQQQQHQLQQTGGAFLDAPSSASTAYAHAHGYPEPQPQGQDAAMGMQDFEAYLTPEALESLNPLDAFDGFAAEMQVQPSSAPPTMLNFFAHGVEPQPQPSPHAHDPLSMGAYPTPHSAFPNANANGAVDGAGAGAGWSAVMQSYAYANHALPDGAFSPSSELSLPLSASAHSATYSTAHSAAHFPFSSPGPGVPPDSLWSGGSHWSDVAAVEAAGSYFHNAVLDAGEGAGEGARPGNAGAGAGGVYGALGMAMSLPLLPALGGGGEEGMGMGMGVE